MHRTTIMLPERLKSQVDEFLSRKKLSLGELVRQALQKFLLVQTDPYANDPFFASTTVFDDEGPDDVALRHDDYLNAATLFHHASRLRTKSQRAKGD